MKKGVFLKLVSIILILTFSFQTLYAGVYADSLKNNPVTKENKVRERPVPKKLVTKKAAGIPQKLKQKYDMFDKWKGKKELTQKRTSNSKTFLNNDGTETAVIYLGPVHAQNKNGGFEDIDNSLVAEKGQKSFKNKLGIYDVSFDNKSENPSVKIAQNGTSIEIIPENAEAKGYTLDGSQMLYQGKQKGIEYLYSVQNSGVKEDIILSHYVENASFKYDMKLKGACTAELEDGVIKIRNNAGGEDYFSISAPCMTDANGNESSNITLKLEKQGGSYEITLNADENWLKDASRAYPVTIDPIYEARGGSKFFDTYVQQKNGQYNQLNAEMIYVGYDDGKASGNTKLYGTCKESTIGYISFGLPSDIKENTTINSAVLKMYKYTNWSSATRKMDLSKVTSPLDISDVTWSTRPSAGNPTVTTDLKSGTGWYTWNINQFINEWKTNKSPNYGLTLKTQNDYAQAECFESSQTFRSHPPYVQINYTNTAPKPPVSKDLELVLERGDIYSNGTAYAKSQLVWDGETQAAQGTDKINKATIKYRLMPDGISDEISEENFTTLDWKTKKFDLQPDKAYWIEADIKVEK